MKVWRWAAIIAISSGISFSHCKKTKPQDAQTKDGQQGSIDGDSSSELYRDVDLQSSPEVLQSLKNEPRFVQSLHELLLTGLASKVLLGELHEERNPRDPDPGLGRLADHFNQSKECVKLATGKAGSCNLGNLNAGDNVLRRIFRYMGFLDDKILLSLDIDQARSEYESGIPISDWDRGQHPHACAYVENLIPQEDSKDAGANSRCYQGHPFYLLRGYCFGLDPLDTVQRGDKSYSAYFDAIWGQTDPYDHTSNRDYSKAKVMMSFDSGGGAGIDYATEASTCWTENGRSPNQIIDFFQPAFGVNGFFNPHKHGNPSLYNGITGCGKAVATSVMDLGNAHKLNENLRFFTWDNTISLKWNYSKGDGYGDRQEFEKAFQSANNCGSMLDNHPYARIMGLGWLSHFGVYDFASGQNIDLPSKVVGHVEMNGETKQFPWYTFLHKSFLSVSMEPRGIKKTYRNWEPFAGDRYVDLVFRLYFIGWDHMFFKDLSREFSRESGVMRIPSREGLYFLANEAFAFNVIWDRSLSSPSFENGGFRLDTDDLLGEYVDVPSESSSGPVFHGRGIYEYTSFIRENRSGDFPVSCQELRPYLRLQAMSSAGRLNMKSHIGGLYDLAVQGHVSDFGVSKVANMLRPEGEKEFIDAYYQQYSKIKYLKSYAQTPGGSHFGGEHPYEIRVWPSQLVAGAEVSYDHYVTRNPLAHTNTDEKGDYLRETYGMQGPVFDSGDSGPGHYEIDGKKYRFTQKPDEAIERIVSDYVDSYNLINDPNVALNDEPMLVAYPLHNEIIGLEENSRSAKLACSCDNSSCENYYLGFYQPEAAGGETGASDDSGIGQLIPDSLSWDQAAFE